MDHAAANTFDDGLDERGIKSRVIQPAVITSIGLVASLGVFFLAQAWEREQRIARFHDTAAERVEVLRATIGSGLEALQSLGAFLQNSREVSRREFQSFSEKSLARHPEVQAFSWSAVVPHTERAAVENFARSAGFPAFRFTELNDLGELVPAAERDDYVAVLYVEPYAGNEATLGYDIASNPIRHQSILSARDSGSVMITERITPIQEASDQFGVLILFPVYRQDARIETVEDRQQNLKGFAVGVYRVSDMVEMSLASTPGQFNFYLFDQSAAPGKQRLYPRHSEVESAGQLNDPLLLKRSLDVAGRDWLIAVLPSEHGFHEGLPWVPWGVLVVGLLFTALLTLYVRTVLDQRAQVQRTVRMRTQELGQVNRVLRQNEQALQRAQSELERRVEERTAQLRESEARFRDYAEAASDVLWEMDENLRYTSFSGRFKDLTGIDETSLLGKTRWEIVGADADESEAWRRHREDLETRRPFRDFSYDRLDAQGRPHHFRVNGRPIFGPDGEFRGYRGTASDVTAEVEAETARQLSEAKLRDVVEHLPSAVVLKDLEGRFLLTNRRFQEWFALSESEIVGRTSHDLYPAEVAQSLVRQDRETLENGRVTEQEITIPLLDGRVHSIIITKFPVLGADGEIIGIGAINTDITERRNTEAQLHQSQKMEAVGQLTGGVAHDFNNLLAVILGNLELMADQLPPDDELSARVRSAFAAAERGASLTERLLAFSRKQMLQPEEVDINELVQGMLELLSRSLGENIEIAVTSDHDLRLSRVDPRQLESALLNLAINGRDAMPDGGRLAIESTNVRVDNNSEASARLAGLEPGDYVCLAVEDDGCGMSPELIEQAFDPFFTTKEVGKGTGLGLSMVYGFVRQSGGHVRIESEEGKGTTVRLFLPAAADGAAKVMPRPTASDQVLEGQGETVLVVEDNAELRILVVKMLLGLGYQVMECESGQSALDRLTATGPVDLLLTDLKLPGGLSGTQLADQTLQRWPGMSVVYMTGNAEDAFSGGGQDDGVPLLHKPFRKVEVARAIRETLEGRLNRESESA